MDRPSGCSRSTGINPLRGLGEQLLTLVWESASAEQIGSWLRVPLEHAASRSGGGGGSGGDYEALCVALLEAGADAFVRREPVLDRSPLLAAAQAGNTAVVSALLENGSGPDGEDWELSVFRHAVFAADCVVTGSTSLVADTNTNSSCCNTGGGGRRTPLHFAAAGGHASMVRALVRAGADVDVEDGDGCTPLHLAVFRGFEGVVTFLVQAGARVDTSDSEGESPLHTASAHGSLGMVRAILRGSTEKTLLSPTDNLEMSPLHRAALGGHCEVMNELLRHGSSLSSLAANARTALHAAAMSGSGDAVRFLLAHDYSSLEAKDHDGRTPLHLASGHRLGSDSTLVALVESGANVEARTSLGETPLHKACESLRVSAVQQLLLYGADQAAVDAGGRTPAALTAQLFQSQCPGMFRDMLQRILSLLATAPADRTWRRRGWLLMLRSRQQEGGERVGGGNLGTRWLTADDRGEHRHAPGTRCCGNSVATVADAGFGVISRCCWSGPEDGMRPWKSGKTGNSAALELTAPATTARDRGHGPRYCQRRTATPAFSRGTIGRGVDGEAALPCGGEHGDSDLRCVVQRAVGFHEDGLFRNIVAFL
ncbi:unnamed protein product [Scytosiphon promiscuus]